MSKRRSADNCIGVTDQATNKSTDQTSNKATDSAIDRVMNSHDTKSEDCVDCNN